MLPENLLESQPDALGNSLLEARLRKTSQCLLDHLFYPVPEI